MNTAVRVGQTCSPDFGDPDLWLYDWTGLPLPGSSSMFSSVMVNVTGCATLSSLSVAITMVTLYTLSPLASACASKFGRLLEVEPSATGLGFPSTSPYVCWGLGTR